MDAAIEDAALTAGSPTACSSAAVADRSRLQDPDETCGARGRLCAEGAQACRTAEAGAVAEATSPPSG
eukprot:5222861-Pleurochrysis_carterae.AAC.1